MGTVRKSRSVQGFWSQYRQNLVNFDNVHDGLKVDVSGRKKHDGSTNPERSVCRVSMFQAFNRQMLTCLCLEITFVRKHATSNQVRPSRATSSFIKSRQL